MENFGIIFVGLLGIVLGSFLNVLVLRYNTGRGVSGRSMCFSCGTHLRWFELVPVLSFVFLRGRCRTCHARISIQYPIVEIVSGILFVLAFLLSGLQEIVASDTLVTFVVLALLSYLWLFIAVYDSLHKMIPRPIVWSANAIALVFVLLFRAEPVWNVVGTLLATLPLFLIWLFSRGRAMGLGDSELFLGLGLLAGFSGVFSALAFSFWIGALVSLGVLGYSRLRAGGGSVTMKSEIPFGPFLIAGALLVIFFQINALSLFEIF